MLKRNGYMVAMVSLVAFSSVAFAADQDSKNNGNHNVQSSSSYNEDTTNIVITKKSPAFSIKLKSNPTTGYSWFLREYDTSLISPVKHRYLAPEKSLIGSAGVEVWDFKAKPAAFVVPHETTIRMVYARPWNTTDTGTQKVFHIVTKAE